MDLDLNQYLTLGGLSALLMLLLTFVKQYIPQAQKTLIPYVALGLGIFLALLFAGATDHLSTLYTWVSYTVLGLLAGLASVGIHEATLQQIEAKAPPPAFNIVQGPPPTVLVDGHELPDFVKPPPPPIP